MTKTNKQKIPLLPEVADTVMFGNIRHFIGLLIGEEDVLGSLPHEIRTDTHLPLGMHSHEGQVLDAIYLCRNLSQSPTRNNIVHLLEASGVIKDASKFIDDILEESSNRQPKNAALMAHTIDVWINEQKLAKIAEIIPDIRKRPTLDYTQKFNEVLQLITEAAPTERDWEMYDEVEMAEAFLEENRKLVEDRKAGRDLGPELPFDYAKKTFGYMEWGELTTIMAKSGYGKTTLALAIAEHVAWNQKLSCDVHMFVPETSVKIVSRRQISRHTLIPYQVMKDGLIDFDSKKWKPVWDQFMAIKTQQSNDRGYINFIACPGADANWVVSKMHELARTSQSLGRSCVFIIDYLQRLRWQAEGLDQHQGFESIGDKISNETRRLYNNGLRSHTILFAQEGGTEGEAFGSTVIRKISQLVMRIGREEVEGGVKVPAYYVSKDGNNKNALGERRTLCNIGDKYTERGYIEISKANDAPPSRIQVIFEGPLSIITQDPSQMMERQGPVINPGREQNPQSATVTQHDKFNQNGNSEVNRR